MTPADMKYKAELHAIEESIELLTTEGRNLLSYSDLIELMKLNLEVQKEIHRLESEDI